MIAICYILGSAISVTVIGSTLFLMAVNNAYGVPLSENIKQSPELLLTSIQLHGAFIKTLFVQS
jgi:hypothetical protein